MVEAYKNALKEDYIMVFGYKCVYDKGLKEFDFEICGNYSNIT